MAGDWYLLEKVAPPIIGGTSKLLSFQLPPVEDYFSQSLYLNYKIVNSGSSIAMQVGAYVEWTRLMKSNTPTPAEQHIFSFYPQTALRFSIDNGETYLPVFNYQYNGFGNLGTLIDWELIEYNPEADSSSFKYSFYATYRAWINPMSDTSTGYPTYKDYQQVVFPAGQTTKISLSWICTDKNGATYRDSDAFYLSFANIPYIDSYPKEITDTMDSFNIEYYVPDPTQMDYISFGLLDKTDNLLVGYKLAPVAEDSYSFLFSDQDKEILYNKFNDVNTAGLQFAVKYKNLNSDPIIMTYPVVFDIVITPPTLEYTVKDVDEFTRSLTGRGDEGVVVKGKSDIQFTLTPRAYKNASIAHYYVRNDGLQVSGKETVIFKDTEYSVFTLYIKDSRGNVYTEKITLDTVNYLPPTCNLAADIPKADNTIKVTLHGQYYDGSFGAQNNFLQFKYKYTSNISSNDIDWTSITPESINIGYGSYNTTLLIPIPNQADTYTITFQVIDAFGPINSNSVTVKATPVFDWGQHDFKFNVPVTVNNDLIVTGQIIKGDGTAAIADDPAMDYIVEQGIKTTGSGNSTANWVYRKWNSGVAECWCRKHIQTGVSTSWGGLYVSGALPHTNIVWPINFTDIPVANITIAPNASGAFLIAGGSTNLTATNTGGYEIARGTSLSSGNFYINYYGIGQWK